MFLVCFIVLKEWPKHRMEITKSRLAKSILLVVKLYELSKLSRDKKSSFCESDRYVRLQKEAKEESWKNTEEKNSEILPNAETTYETKYRWL